MQVEAWMREGAGQIGRVGDRVVEHDSRHSWWRCETCGRTGHANHSNDTTVHYMLPSLLRKARAHRCH